MADTVTTLQPSPTASDPVVALVGGDRRRHSRLFQDEVEGRRIEGGRPGRFLEEAGQIDTPPGPPDVHATPRRPRFEDRETAESGQSGANGGNGGNGATMPADDAEAAAEAEERVRQRRRAATASGLATLVSLLF